MIKTAKIIDMKTSDDTVGLFDTVTIYIEEDDCEEDIRIVTTLRRDPNRNIISKESPLGSALMGRKKDDRILVEVSPTMNYYVRILEIIKGEDNEDLPISGY